MPQPANAYATISVRVRICAEGTAQVPHDNLVLTMALAGRYRELVPHWLDAAGPSMAWCSDGGLALLYHEYDAPECRMAAPRA